MNDDQQHLAFICMFLRDKIFRKCEFSYWIENIHLGYFVKAVFIIQHTFERLNAHIRIAPIRIFQSQTPF